MMVQGNLKQSRTVNELESALRDKENALSLALERLNESEQRFGSLFDTLSQGIVYQDTDGKIILANSSAQEMLGLILDQVMGRSSRDPHWKSIHEDGSDYPGEEHPAMVALKSGKKVTDAIMGVYNPQAGSYKWLLINATPLFRNNEPAPYQVYTTFSDFTELKVANSALRDSEKRLMNLYTNMGEGVALHKLVFDDQGEAKNYRIVGINPRFEKILGIREKDVLDKLATEAYNVEDPPFFEEYFNVVKTGIPHSFEVDFPPLDKSFSISVSPWDLDGFVTIFTDITHRRQAEEKLQESEAKFRSLAENAPYAIMIYQDDFWVYCNQAGEAISGFTAEELCRQKFWEFVAPEYTETVKQVGKKRQTGVRALSSYEFRIITKTGHPKWVYLTGTSTVYEGRPAGIISVVDVTDRKRIELELKAAVEKAMESDRLKSSFLANMSHEIRTPMNAILGFSELIGQPDASQGEQERFAGIIRNAGKRLLHIIDDIIDLSKLEARQIEISRSNCNLHQLVNSTVESFGNMELLKKKTELRLVSDLNDFPVGFEVETDTDRLQQIVDNLISNAIKYTSKGTIVFGLRKKQENDQDYIEFFVRDTGKGIPPEKLSIIFERFRQVEENEYHEGAGLGLSICKAFVELLGGHIHVESKVGKGSIFSFAIPLIPLAAAGNPVVSPAARKSPDLSKTVILIAEDEADSYLYLEHLLKETNAKLLRAVNGRILMEMLATSVPDLLLLDINMPGLTGYQCLTEIRKEGYPLKVIAQTAYAMTEERKRLLDAGCNAYLAKPFSKKALFESIAEVLSED
ncbi:MAG: PAS domain S-box protein [Bacteroidota bacterium]